LSRKQVGNRHQRLCGITGCCISQRPMQWDEADFDPSHLSKRSADFDETSNL